MRRLLLQSLSLLSMTSGLQPAPLPLPLILGTKSFSRTEILRATGLPFEKLVYPINEKAIGNREKDDPSELVMNIALAKADAIVAALRAGKLTLPEPLSQTDGVGACILTADQVVVCDGVVREKPRDIEEAVGFVQQYGDKPPSTVGSVLLTHVPSGLQASRIFTGRVIFEPRIGEEARLLVDKIEEEKREKGGISCLDCAGGLMVEHPCVVKYINTIEGGEDSIMGLSKDAVFEAMSELATKLAGQ